MAKIQGKQIEMTSLADGSTIIGSSGELVIKDDGVLSKHINFIDDGLTLTSSAEGQLLLSDGAELKAKSVSGDITISKAGVTAIGSGKVVTGMLADDAVLPGKINFIDDALSLSSGAEGQLLLSEGSELKAKTVTGDVTITKAGVTAIGASKVVTSMINNNAVNSAKLDQTDSYDFSTSGSVKVGTPTLSAHAVPKSYVDAAIDGLHWEAPVLKVTETAPPAGAANGDRFLIMDAGGGSGTWSSYSQYDLVMMVGGSWIKDTASMQTGSAVLDQDDGIIYVYNGSRWNQASMPTEYAFGQGLVSNSGVVDVQLVANGGLHFAGTNNDFLQIQDEKVTRAHLAKASAQGTIMVSNSAGVFADLAQGSGHEVLTSSPSGGLAYVKLANDNIANSAGIAITKLAAHTISGKDLGTNLDHFEVVANNGLALKAKSGGSAVTEYDGSADVTINLDFKVMHGVIGAQGGNTLDAATSGNNYIRKAKLQGPPGTDLDIELLAAAHIMGGDVLGVNRNGVQHLGQYKQSGAVASGDAPGTYRLYQGSGADADHVFFEIMEGDPSGTHEEYDDDVWTFLLFAKN